MALHTPVVRAWWTARRRPWHAGGHRMLCGAVTVIHLHAVSGTIALHSTAPMPSAWSSAWPCTKGKYGLGRPSSSLHRTQAAPACRLWSRATPGRSGCGKAPLTAWAAWARVPMGKYHSERVQGSPSGCAPPESHRHLESGGAAGTVPVCKKWRALLLGCRWRVAARLNPSARAPLGGRPGACARRNPGRPARRGACGGVLRCQVPHNGEHRPCGEGPRPWRGVHLDGQLWTRAPHAGCVEHPSDHVCREDLHHSRGLYDNPLRWPAAAAPGVQGHFRLARMGDPVDGLVDVHAAPRGLIQNPAPRHPVAQGGTCGRVPHRGQRSVMGACSGVWLGAPGFSGAVAPFPRGAEGGPDARRRRSFCGRAARGGLRDYLK